MSRLALPLVVALLLVAAGARAEPVTLAVPDFTTSDPDGAARARHVGVLVATRLAQRPGVRIVGSDQVRAALEHARERALLGTEDPQTLRDVAAVLGVAYLLRGELERFGERRVLVAVVLDAGDGRAVARLRVDAASEDDLPGAADRLGEQLAEVFGLPPSEVDAELISGRALVGGANVVLNLKLGSTLANLQGFSVDAFTLRFEVEADVVLYKWLQAYIEIGVLIGRAKSDQTQSEGTFSLIPAGAGLKLVLRREAVLRPFFSLGCGLGYFAALVDAANRVAFQAELTTGVTWYPWERFGIVAELRADLDTHLTYGFTANFGIAVAF